MGRRRIRENCSTSNQLIFDDNNTKTTHCVNVGPFWSAVPNSERRPATGHRGQVGLFAISRGALLRRFRGQEGQALALGMLPNNSLGFLQSHPSRRLRVQALLHKLQEVARHHPRLPETPELVIQQAAIELDPLGVVVPVGALQGHALKQEHADIEDVADLKRSNQIRQNVATFAQVQQLLWWQVRFIQCLSASNDLEEYRVGIIQISHRVPILSLFGQNWMPPSGVSITSLLVNPPTATLRRLKYFTIATRAQAMCHSSSSLNLLLFLLTKPLFTTSLRQKLENRQYDSSISWLLQMIFAMSFETEVTGHLRIRQ